MEGQDLLVGGKEQDRKANKAATEGIAHDFSRIPVFASPNSALIQPKLIINAPGDAYEQEADHMADQVMRMPLSNPPVIQRGGSFLQRKCAKCGAETENEPHEHLMRKADDSHCIGGTLGLKMLQRKCAACEEEEQKEGTLMRKGGERGGYLASAGLAAQLNATKGGGFALSASTKVFMENAFGADFTGVRVHTDAKAADMSRGIQAKAFTHGQDIYFNRGAYAPESSEGKRLLAHELTHTVQQAESGAIQRRAVSESRYALQSPQSVMQSLGKGSPLDGGTRSRMEGAFGADFSGVSVHTDSHAAGLVSSMNARAFAVGNHIAFGSGEHQPGTLMGDALMAHELAHVVQQSNSSFSSSSAGSTELEADATFSAIGATASLHLETNSGTGKVNEKHRPKFKSGLQLQRCGGSRERQMTACSEGVQDVGRQPQGQRNGLDARAQSIITAAQDSSVSLQDRALQSVNAIICAYMPTEASKVRKIIYDSSEPGLGTKRVGTGSSAQGDITVGDYFVNNITEGGISRRVLQVAHELEHIDQYRSGLTGEDRSDEREFLAFYQEATAVEFIGTGRMTHSTRLNLVDGALGYYHCLSSDIQSQYASEKRELDQKRGELLASSRLTNGSPEPTSCRRQVPRRQ